MEWFVTSIEAPGPNSTLIKPNAFECIMEFCVKAYMANMTGGIFTERVVSEFPGLNQTLQNEPLLPNNERQFREMKISGVQTSVGSVQGSRHTFSGTETIQVRYACSWSRCRMWRRSTCSTVIGVNLTRSLYFCRRCRLLSAAQLYISYPFSEVTGTDKASSI